MQIVKTQHLWNNDFSLIHTFVNSKSSIRCTITWNCYRYKRLFAPHRNSMWSRRRTERYWIENRRNRFVYIRSFRRYTIVFTGFSLMMFDQANSRGRFAYRTDWQKKKTRKIYLPLMCKTFFRTIPKIIHEIRWRLGHRSGLNPALYYSERWRKTSWPQCK